MGLNYRGSIRGMLDSLPYQVKNLDLVDFLNTMVNLHYKVNYFELNPKTMDSRLLPCLFHPKTLKGSELAPLVIIKKDEESIECFDPVEEKTFTYAIDAFPYTRGLNYFFKPLTEVDTNAETISQNVPPTTFQWMRNIFFRFKGIFIQVIFFSIISK